MPFYFCAVMEIGIELPLKYYKLSENPNIEVTALAADIFNLHQDSTLDNY